MRIQWILFLGLMCCGEPAAAHPVDDLCVGGKWDDKCQPPVAALGFDKPEFFAAHKKYWHCRRALVVEDIVPYGACSGAVSELEELLKIPSGERYISEPGILEYWNVIPAHPELDYPGEAWRPLEQLRSCDATRELASVVLWFCHQRLSWLKSLAATELEKPAVVKTVCCDKKRRNCKVC